MTKYVSAGEFIAHVEARGYKALPLTNSDAVAEGAELQITAYELKGPRGHKTIVLKNGDGLLSLDAANLWCDGVDFATAKITKSKAVSFTVPSTMSILSPAGRAVAAVAEGELRKKALR